MFSTVNFDFKENTGPILHSTEDSLTHGPWEFSQGLITKINHSTYLGHKGPSPLCPNIKVNFTPKLLEVDFLNLTW